MLNVGRLILLLVGVSFSATGLTDDASPSTSSVDVLPPVTLSIESAHHGLDYAPRWRLTHHPVATPTYTNDWSPRSMNVAFHDSGTFSRMSKLRNLSLLTFAEIGRARLFLGVDDNGIVGVHLRAFHRLGDERYLEVARMPYLKKDQPPADTE